MPAEFPGRAMVTAIEALTWGAFQEAMVYEEWILRRHLRFGIWHRSQGRELLHALEARAAPHAYCPLFGHGDRDWPFFIRAVRCRLRRSEGRLVHYAEVAAMLRDEMADIGRREAELRRATDDLLEAIRRTGKPTLWGRLNRSHAQSDPGAALMPIPSDVFMDPTMTVTEYGSVLPEPSLPDAIRRQRLERGPTWSEVLLLTGEVLKLWPRLKAAAAAKTERRFAEWLADFMRAAPDDPPGKEAVKRHAEAAGQHVPGERAFKRCYAEAVKVANAPAWSKPGRKSGR